MPPRAVPRRGAPRRSGPPRRTAPCRSRRTRRGAVPSRDRRRRAEALVSFIQLNLSAICFLELVPAHFALINWRSRACEATQTRRNCSAVALPGLLVSYGPLARKVNPKSTRLKIADSCAALPGGCLGRVPHRCCRSEAAKPRGRGSASVTKQPQRFTESIRAGQRADEEAHVRAEA